MVLAVGSLALGLGMLGASTIAGQVHSASHRVTVIVAPDVPPPAALVLKAIPQTRS